MPLKSIGLQSDIVVRGKRRRSKAARVGVTVRVRVMVDGGADLEPSWALQCRTPAAVEYLRERLRGLMEELDGVRVE